MSEDVDNNEQRDSNAAENTGRQSKEAMRPIIQQKVPYWGPLIVSTVHSTIFLEFLKAIVLVSAIIFARQLFIKQQLFWAIFVLAPAVYWSCYHKTPVAHRALMLFLGIRTGFAAPWEGFFPRIPLLSRYECVDVREYTEKLGYEDFVAGDGIPFSFELFLAFRVVNTEDERKLVEEFSFLNSGSLLRNYLSLGKNSAVSQIESIGQSILEVFFAKYTHNQLIGFSIAEFDNLFQKEIDKDSDQIPNVADIVKKLTPDGNSETMSIREQVAELVQKELNERLNPKGLVITEVEIRDFNLPKGTLHYIQEILRQKFQKAAEVIDVEVDVARAQTLMEAANKEGIDLTFEGAYKLVRGFDVRELAAEKSGLLGPFIDKLGKE